MSYPNQGENFNIYELPPPPRTARELVDALGLEAARDALPDNERRSFDRANPPQEIVAASDRLASSEEALDQFEEHIREFAHENNFNEAQIQVLYQNSAGVQNQLMANIRAAAENARNTLENQRVNLINRINTRGLTNIVAFNSGRYSMPDPRTSAAASTSSSSERRHDRRGGGQGSSRNPLGPTSGNQRRRAR
ncbi:hypothetical protein HCA58_16895 [Micromonospora sp. HNM0581]|uniref:hypothetical protein n=1 Tax=Micromonospora sp. HNM0581 TaxID=2716341 RepID=UPI00146E8835|nr:hypothetical protein [Micromonospora sp. HNM0581]NLU80030.1 hypothetical protein [Micromonospora sp. HNM0581]